jgi:hypothetical protein
MEMKFEDINDIVAKAQKQINLAVDKFEDHDLHNVMSLIEDWVALEASELAEGNEFKVNIDEDREIRFVLNTTTCEVVWADRHVYDDDVDFSYFGEGFGEVEPHEIKELILDVLTEDCGADYDVAAYVYSTSVEGFASILAKTCP